VDFAARRKIVFGLTIVRKKKLEDLTVGYMRMSMKVSQARRKLKKREEAHRISNSILQDKVRRLEEELRCYIEPDCRGHQPDPNPKCKHEKVKGWSSAVGPAPCSKCGHVIQEET